MTVEYITKTIAVESIEKVTGKAPKKLIKGRINNRDDKINIFEYRISEAPDPVLFRQQYLDVEVGSSYLCTYYLEQPEGYPHGYRVPVSLTLIGKTEALVSRPENEKYSPRTSPPTYSNVGVRIGMAINNATRIRAARIAAGVTQGDLFEDAKDILSISTRLENESNNVTSTPTPTPVDKSKPDVASTPVDMDDNIPF